MANFKFLTFYCLFVLLISDNNIYKSDAFILKTLKEIRQNIRDTLIPQKKTYSVVDAEKNYNNSDKGTYTKIDGNNRISIFLICKFCYPI